MDKQEEKDTRTRIIRRRPIKVTEEDGREVGDEKTKSLLFLFSLTWVRKPRALMQMLRILCSDVPKRPECKSFLELIRFQKTVNKLLWI